MIKIYFRSYSTFCVFDFGPWWPTQESDRAKINFPKGVDPGVHVYKVSGQQLQQLRNVPANERTTDDGHHVIA
jgi:hypothetical protein